MVSLQLSQCGLLGPPQVEAAVGVSGPPVQLAWVVDPETVPEVGFAARRAGAHKRAGSKASETAWSALPRSNPFMSISSLYEYRGASLPDRTRSARTVPVVPLSPSLWYSSRHSGGSSPMARRVRNLLILLLVLLPFAASSQAPPPHPDEEDNI